MKGWLSAQLKAEVMEALGGETFKAWLTKKENKGSKIQLQKFCSFSTPEITANHTEINGNLGKCVTHIKANANVLNYEVSRPAMKTPIGKRAT